LYTGLVACPAQIVEARGRLLLGHDRGIDDSRTLLHGLVSWSGHILFPVECVSHEPTNKFKRACETSSRTFRPVRSAGLASFVHAIMPA